MTTPSSTDTRSPKDRLLDAAEALFAERDFDDVPVRELAAAAGMNVAAVNYHFQGKENLHQQVIMRRFSAQRDRTLAGLTELLDSTDGKPRLDEVIRVFVHAYIDGALSNSFLTMMAREMHSRQSRGQAEMFKVMIKPIFGAFSQAMLTARPGLTREDISWFIASVVAQIHHFIFRRLKFDASADDPEVRGFMEQAFPVLSLERDAYVDAVTDHITRFSTAAIDGLRPEENS